MPDTPPPKILWADDLDPHRRPPQTDPPLYAERRAAEVFDRVAGRPRPRRRWYRRAWVDYAAGVGLMAAGGGVWWWQLDLGLMHVPTVALVAVGFAVVVKTLMGYR